MDRPGPEYLGDPVSRDRRLGGQIERPADPPVELAGRVRPKGQAAPQRLASCPGLEAPPADPVSDWLSLLLLTDVVANTAGNLVGSLVNEVVVTEGILEVVSGDCLTCEGRARGLGRTRTAGR